MTFAIDMRVLRERAEQRVNPANAANRLMGRAASVSQLAALAGVTASQTSDGHVGQPVQRSVPMARPHRLTKIDADRAHEQPWSEEQIARFVDRRARLMRWGWSETDAEDMAERIALHDLDGDDRVVCAADCRHYRPGRCGNQRAAGLANHALGRELAMTPQRCEGFDEAETAP